jgi:hypothetical protein
VFLFLLETLAYVLQTIGSNLDKRRKSLKHGLFYGGLAFFVLLRGYNYYDENDKRKALEGKVAYQEAILRKVSKAELSLAQLAVQEEEGKLKLLNGMRSEFAELLKAEDASAGGKKP